LYVDREGGIREKRETMRSFWTALKFLTAFPWPRKLSPTAQEIGRSTPFFPLVGFGLGLILALLNRILEPYLGSEILGVVLVVVLILATRAQELEALGESFDTIRSGAVGEVTNKGGRRGQLGIFGILAVLVVVTLKFRSIEVMGEVRNQGLLLAPVFGRWSMAILAYGSKSEPGPAGRFVMEQVGGRHLLWATILTLILAVLLADRLGLWIALWVSLLPLVAGLYLHRRFGGLSGENLRAVGEIAEAFAMVLFASL